MASETGKPSQTSKPKKSSLLSTSAGGATLLIALQVGSRALTFLVNQILLRFLSPELLGISIHLEVYSISVLFFARESLRVAIQRQTDDVDAPSKEKKDVKKGHVDGDTFGGRTQAIVNLSYISIILGIGFAAVFAWIYLYYTGDPVILGTPYFQESLKLYSVSAVVELLSEPAFVVVQQKSRFTIRARAESVATLSRCLATCGSAIWASRAGRDIGVLPFALGQAAYASSMLLVYIYSTLGISKGGGFSLFPLPMISSDKTAYILSYFSRPLLVLGGSIFTQSIVKHILTQGDTILIATLASQKAQGVYALANNYGGLIARLILQPVEESSRNYFGKLLSSDNSAPTKEVISKARNNLTTLLRSYVLFSTCVLAVGPTIAPLLLKIIAGSRWTDSGAGDVLATYCYYIPLLAINGLTEAFVSSVATKSGVNQQSMWMLAFSAGFAGAAYLFLGVLQWGAKGLVWANVLNMFFRIVWSTAFIQRYLSRNGTTLDIQNLLPKPATIAVGVVTSAILTQMRSTFTGGIMDIIKSGSIAMIFAIILATTERKFLLECYRSFRV